MELPLPLLDSTGFLVRSADELIRAMGDYSENREEEFEIKRLFDLNLPPISSLYSLAVMTGLSVEFLRYLVYEPEKHYRIFFIKKGKKFRVINAPMVVLKAMQKWLSIHFEKKWLPHDAVHGFVKGRSHLTAAHQHLGANWIISLDIKNFFPSTPLKSIHKSLTDLGYSGKSLKIIGSLCSYKTRLPQGAPTSPVLSNICLHDIDGEIIKNSRELGITYTRYADDLVFSGQGEIKKEIIEKVKSIFESSPWKISEKKISCAELPSQLKVHGLLVHGKKIKLTKRYRNKIRAFRHLKENDKIKDDDIYRINGHINYANHVENFGD